MEKILPVRTLIIDNPAGRYPVLVGYGLLQAAGEHLSMDERVAIVTDDNTGPLYVESLAAQWKQATIITLPAGEAFKTLESVRMIYDQLLAADFDRQGTVIGLGGGVINDMAGFAAATFMRGVQFVTCPTTLLSMVDASIGGKTGVDLPQGKNLVGAFKQPALVLVDLQTLNTLPAAEISAGMAEVIKHGLIAAPGILAHIENGTWDRPEAEGGDAASRRRWQELVVAAIEVKRKIVQEDPFEKSVRAYLNLGHTFAHAIEKVSQFAVSHGPAVAIGLVCAAHLSAALGACDRGLQGEIERLLDRVGLPRRIPAGLAPSAIWEAMGSDKKKAGGRVRFVLLRAPGRPYLEGGAPKEAVLATLEALREP